MSQTFKQLIAAIIILVAIGMGYFGAYLPLRKGQIHIAAISELQSGNIRSVGDFNALFDNDFNFYSPVGQDEIISHYLGNLANIINQQTNRQIADIFVKQAENVMAPTLKIKRGFSFNQNLYTLGSIYKIAAIKFKDENYYEKSIEIFNEGLEYSPNRLMFLKGIFELYAFHGEMEKALEIGHVILKYYPDESKVREFIDGIKTQ